MTPERWQQVNEIFHSALGREPARRAAFLDQACDGDHELRQEVESLIRSYEQTGSFIDAPALEAAVELLAEDKAELAAGQRLGHYKILSLLGAGGMGTVYLAQDSRLGRKIALKMLPAAFIKDQERVRRFEQEARAASALNHPNILTIFDIEEVDGLHLIATEYIEGQTLRQRLAEGKLELSEALDLALQVASALSAAHQAGIVHRDIKPENLMLRPDGYVKVLDFGLAKLAERQAVSSNSEPRAFTAVKTDTGVVIGTASYMSPEQAKGQPVDQRSDVFSFGVVLYEMLTGEPAFRRDSDVDTLHAIIHDEPAGLSGLRGKVPAGVGRVLRRCLEKAPEGRYASGGEVLAALKQVVAPARSSTVVFSASVLAGWSRWRQRRWVVLAGAVLLVAGVVWWRISRSAAENIPPTASQAPPAAMKTAPLTGLPGKEDEPAFSPDGKYVAFTSSGEGDDNYDIYVKPVDGGTPQRLTTNPAADLGPAWSPDGRYIAFIRFSENERAIFTMPALGGPERKLLSTNVVPPEGDSSHVDWSPDQKWLVYSDASAPKRPSAIYRISYETLETQQLTFPPATSVGDYQPVFSPDGQMLAFSRWASFQVCDIYVMAVGDGEPRRLTFDNKLIIGLAWTPDGRSIIFGSERGGAMGLWRIAADGGEPERLGIGDNAAFPAISRQGQRLAYVTEHQTMSIWRLDLPDSRGKALSRTRMLPSTTGEFLPQISPDGKRIVFSSYRSGAPEIWECDSDGSNLLQLTRLGHGNTGAPRWSPDGRYVAFDSSAEASGDIYVIGANGGQPHRLTEDPSDDIVPSWSRDGRWIYFASNRTGEYQVWKMSAGGGDAVQMTRHGGFVAFKSTDGKYVYYAKGLNLPGLWRVPIEGGQEELVLDRLKAGGWGLWAVAEKGIYFTEPEGKGGVIEFFDFATRQVTRIATMDRPPNPDLAVSPDGRWLLYTEAPARSNSIVLVENFR